MSLTIFAVILQKIKIRGVFEKGKARSSCSFDTKILGASKNAKVSVYWYFGVYLQVTRYDSVGSGGN